MIPCGVAEYDNDDLENTYRTCIRRSNTTSLAMFHVCESGLIASRIIALQSIHVRDLLGVLDFITLTKPNMLRFRIILNLVHKKYIL